MPASKPASKKTPAKKAAPKAAPAPEPAPVPAPAPAPAVAETPVQEARSILNDITRATSVLVPAVAALAAQGVVSGTVDHWVTGVLGGAATLATALYAVLGGKKK